MKANPLPDQNLLTACIEYDPLTGALTWKVRPEWAFPLQAGRTPTHIANAWNAAWAGKPALASPAKNLYLRGAFNGQTLYAHRVIVKLVLNIDPDDVDHDNGIRSDNRWENLVPCSRQRNMVNRALSRNNTSGVVGVSWSNRHKLWSASIYDQGKQVHLGWFKKKDDAIQARQEAEIKYGYHPAHGKR